MKNLVAMGLSLKLKSILLYVAAFLFGYLVVDLTGLFRYPLEISYDREFSYPLDVPDFLELVHKYRKGESTSFQPINLLYESLKWTELPYSRCNEKLRLLVLVKSALSNFDRRKVIRSTWGFERRFSDVPIKVVFLLGSQAQDVPDAERLEKDIQTEISSHHDILRADFVDTYYNNTLKFMMGMRWAVRNCSNFQFLSFFDDDMYISMKNLLKFVRNPTGYPEYWDSVKPPDTHQREENQNSLDKKSETGSHAKAKFYMQMAHGHKAVADYNIDLDPTVRLYAGYVFFVKPHRHKIDTKWFVPISEYPFSHYPPYVPAGTLVLSKSAAEDIYFASLFTQHFRFDDIFIGFCAKKMGIEPYHSDHFRFWPGPTKDPYHPDNKFVITAHQFGDPHELLKFWTIQKSLGNA